VKDRPAILPSGQRATGAALVRFKPHN
jgi:hypothetical protein